MTAAIAYKNGVSRAELAEWYDVQRRTIYSWFKRLFFEPLEQAVHDDHRSGRSGKLTAGQQAQLAKTLQESSTETGYDTPAWTPMLVQQYLDEQFGMEYSRPSCRRLMKEVGLSYQQPCRKTAEAGAEDRNTFDDELKKSGELDATVVCIDQTRNQYKPSRVVSARHAQPAVDLSSQRDWTCLLGAITEDGNRFFSRFTEYVTGEHSKHFILALCEEFDDDLIVVLDGAPYVQAAVVTDLAARDALALVWLPARIHRN